MSTSGRNDEEVVGETGAEGEAVSDDGQPVAASVNTEPAAEALAVASGDEEPLDEPEMSPELTPSTPADEPEPER